MRAVSAPAAPAHHTCCFCPCCACRCRRCPQRSAFVVASRPERCCEPQSPAGPLRRTRVCFTLLSLRKMVSLDATTTSGYNQMVRCDLITCVLVRAARHDRRPLARRPSSQRARRMTGSVQRHFRDGRKASTGARRDTGSQGQDTRPDSRVVAPPGCRIRTFWCSGASEPRPCCPGTDLGVGIDRAGRFGPPGDVIRSFIR